MIHLTETNLADTLRIRCDSVQNRIWVVSPFVGNVSDIDCILGHNWSNAQIDRRLIFDSVSGSMSHDTFNEFIKRGIEMKSLASVHAKIYIIDNWCLITSANLTASAFSKRYEIGNSIEDENSVNLIVDIFNKWWKKSVCVNSQTPINEINTSNKFSVIHSLPPKPNFKRKLKLDELKVTYIVGVWNSPTTERESLILKCRTYYRNMGDIPVILYDDTIVKSFKHFLNTKNKSSMSFEECEKELPDELKYISHVKNRWIQTKRKYVMRYIKSIADGYNYKGFEYLDMGYFRPSRNGWKQAEPYIQNGLLAFIICNSDDPINIEEKFEKTKKYLLEDYYVEYSPERFPKLHS